MTSVNEHGPKLSEDLSSSEDSGIAEEEGLLREWKLPQDEGESPRPRKWIAKRTLALSITIGTIVLLVISLVAWYLSTPNYEHLGEVQTNDYVLNPRWNTQSPPQRREFHWTIKDHVFNPDGVFRPMILVNNQFPGPLIEANEGDTIVVQVDNLAINATSIHWHGIFQNGTPYMDGTVGLTQCPIAPGVRFTYEFTVANQSGTYWWHAHYGVQASDGLYGPLVIHDRKKRDRRLFQYATDRVVLVSDHYHDLSSALLWQYLKPGMENAEPVPDGGLINGKGMRNCDSVPNRKCDNTSSHVGMPTFNLKANQRHRLRFINVGAFAEFQLQVDEHELAVVEADGTEIVPKHYHRINISPAQRYSVVLDARSQTGGSFWMRARMVTKCFTDPPDHLQSEVRAVVRYETHSNDLPTSKDWDEKADLICKDMDPSELKPVEAVSAPAKADAFIYLRSNFEIGAYRLSRGFFNGSSWSPNVRSPTLLRSMEGLSTGNASFSSASKSSVGTVFVNDAAFDISKELVVQSTGIQTIDIMVSNFDDGNHPLHLHGYKYFVLAQGLGYPPLTYTGADITPEHLKPLYDSLDLSNPLRRDTATVEGFGWILLRFVADNPGTWAFHCHLSWHSEAGMLMQFLTRSEQLSRLEVPEAHLQLCSVEGIEKGIGPEDAAYEDLAK